MHSRCSRRSRRQGRADWPEGRSRLWRPTPVRCLCTAGKGDGGSCSMHSGWRKGGVLWGGEVAGPQSPGAQRCWVGSGARRRCTLV